MKTFNQIMYFAFTIFFLVSCGKKQVPAEKETSFVEITKKQFTNDGMQLGKMEARVFENIIKCNGTIVPLPDGRATINAPLSGIVKHIRCQNGDFVEKNQILLEISGNEIIDLQKDFAEASAIYKRLKNDYERVKLLFNEKVTPEKEFIVVESEYKTSVAKYTSLKLKLEAIGLPVFNIENGEFYSSYTLKSPIGGYVSGIKTSLGSYVDLQSSLMEITDPDMVQLELTVFSSDISSVRKGQEVRFKSLNASDYYRATIRSVGVVIDNDSKTINCYASINDKNKFRPIAQEYVESLIVTGTDTVNALPTEAIIKTETGHVILVVGKQENDRFLFNKLEVTTGRQNNGFTEIVRPETDAAIAVKGIYNVSL